MSEDSPTKSMRPLPAEGPPQELRPGFASEEVQPTRAPEEPVPADLYTAHYGGMEADEALETWKRETLCFGCLKSNMCRVGVETAEPLIVVTRCVAFVPGAG